MQRYNWINTFNTRDLGYTQTMDGKCIMPLRFIRSDAPHTVSDDEKDFLLRNHIKTVIDLRNNKIAELNPNAFVI